MLLVISWGHLDVCCYSWRLQDAYYKFLVASRCLLLIALGYFLLMRGSFWKLALKRCSILDVHYYFRVAPPCLLLFLGGFWGLNSWWVGNSWWL